MKLNFIKKYHFVFDKGKKNKKLKNTLLRKYKNYSPVKSKVIIVLGGDGFMLHTLKKYYKYNKPFYGINTGSFGFLMNEYKIKSLDMIIKKSKEVLISPLTMNALTKNKKSFRAIAVNEISLLRQTRQTASIKITSNNKNLISFLYCILECITIS